MQLGDLVKPIEKMTDDELLEHLRAIKHRRTVERPAHRAIVERSEKKESRGKLKKAGSLIENLSEEERQALIAQLSQEE